MWLHNTYGKCRMTTWMEGRPFKVENRKAITNWLFEDIIYRWGCITEIVTNNGSPAVGRLEQKYGIKGIKISAHKFQGKWKNRTTTLGCMADAI